MAAAVAVIMVAQDQHLMAAFQDHLTMEVAETLETHV
jgi:hypothetical protein